MVKGIKLTIRQSYNWGSIHSFIQPTFPPSRTSPHLYVPTYKHASDFTLIPFPALLYHTPPPLCRSVSTSNNSSFILFTVGTERNRPHPLQAQSTTTEILQTLQSQHGSNEPPRTTAAFRKQHICHDACTAA